MFVTGIYLSGRGAAVTDEDLERVPRLSSVTAIELSGTAVTDGLRHLAAAKTLVRIDLKGLRLSDGAVEALKKALPDATIGR